MSIETLIQGLTDALNANTAALLGAKVEVATPAADPKPAVEKPAAKSAAAKTKPAATKTEAAAPTATLEEAMDRGLKFVSEHGRDALISLMEAKFKKPKIRDFENDGVTLAKIIAELDAFAPADEGI